MMSRTGAGYVNYIAMWIRTRNWIYSLLKITTMMGYNSNGIQAQITITKHSLVALEPVDPLI
jgi:hypothetical protein